MKDIPGYEGRYAVTRDGKVWSYKSNIFLKGRKSLGYFRVAFVDNGKQRSKLIHRLVGFSYIPNPENKPFINHINGIRNDNRVENLEWVTFAENVQDGWKRGRKISNKQREAWKINRKLAGIKKSKKVMQLTKEGVLCKVYSSCKEATSITNITHISDCALGKKKYAGGYLWKYINI